jgi:hypothetical protein
MGLVEDKKQLPQYFRAAAEEQEHPVVLAEQQAQRLAKKTFVLAKLNNSWSQQNKTTKEFS